MKLETPFLCIIQTHSKKNSLLILQKLLAADYMTMLPALQTQGKVETPQLCHCEPLRMPNIRSEPLHPFAGSRETTFRIPSKFNSPPNATRRKPFLVLLRSHIIASINSYSKFSPSFISLLCILIVIRSGSSSLVSSRSEIVVQPVWYYWVKSLELRSARFYKFLHIDFSRWNCWDFTAFASIASHWKCYFYLHGNWAYERAAKNTTDVC